MRVSPLTSAALCEADEDKQNAAVRNFTYATTSIAWLLHGRLCNICTKHFNLIVAHFFGGADFDFERSASACGVVLHANKSSET